MAYEDLRDWLTQVEALGELRHVKGASWQEDIGRIAEMLHHTDEAPAVMCDEIPDYPPGYRILLNANGARRRLALTLGLPVDIGRWELVEAWEKMLDELKPIPPVYVDDGPVMENVHTGDEVNVLEFPTPKWHELDGGRYIGTGSMDITRDPDEDWVNLGTYRVMIHDEKRVGFYISPGKHGRIHRDKYFARGEPCPVAVVVGSDPLLFIASTLEVPYGMSEYAWAGGLRGRPFEVIKGPVTGLPIPAQAEIVLEGFAYPGEEEMEGPFGEWTGYYASSARPEPVIRVEAIYHRNDPIMLGVPPNKPPYEAHRYRVYLRSGMLKRQLEAAGVPDVTAVWCHGVGGCRLLNVVAIKQRYPGHARQAGHVAAMCRVGAYLGRIVIVVDDDVDVSDLDDVMWAVCTRSDPERSLDIIHRAWSGPLDPAIPSGEKGFNSRLIIDACRPWEWRDEFPPAIGPSPEVRRQTRERWGYLLK
ncbi:MAG: UbiD family decarboxylase [Anaerolineae bacterium]|nr:UbiD family decarboxylase [Anaerolineae bacterium]